MRVILAATEDGPGTLAQAWRQHCGDYPEVTFHVGSILDLEVEAVVSPANSFGFMDGGIDAAYSAHFPGIQRKVQKEIREQYEGELLVGQAAVVETGNHRIKNIIVAPTMRVPMILEGTVNPYLAARAALRAGLACRFESVAFPGSGRGSGG